MLSLDSIRRLAQRSNRFRKWPTKFQGAYLRTAAQAEFKSVYMLGSNVGRLVEAVRDWLKRLGQNGRGVEKNVQTTESIAGYVRC